MLRRNESPDIAAGAVERELRPMLTALAEQLGIEIQTTPPIDLAPADIDLSNVALPAWVDDLKKLLADGDVGAQQLWMDRGAELKDVLPANVHAQVRRAIDNFEFDAALAALSTEKAAT